MEYIIIYQRNDPSDTFQKFKSKFSGQTRTAANDYV